MTDPFESTESLRDYIEEKWNERPKVLATSDEWKTTITIKFENVPPPTAGSIRKHLQSIAPDNIEIETESHMSSSGPPSSTTTDVDFFEGTITDFRVSTDQINAEVASEVAQADVELDDFKETIEEVIDDLAKTAEESAKQEVPKLSTEELQEGDQVIVENTDGNRVSGVIQNKRDLPAEKFTVDSSGGIPLMEYWANKGVHIDPDEDVYTVLLGDSGYDYPESRISKGVETVSGVNKNNKEAIRNAGYLTVKDLKEATQQELSSIDGVGNALAARIKADVGKIETKTEDELTHVGYKCSNCGESFSTNSHDAVEENGEWYCSIECLNDELSQ